MGEWGNGGGWWVGGEGLIRVVIGWFEDIPMHSCNHTSMQYLPILQRIISIPQYFIEIKITNFNEVKVKV